jgi:hypothetical protein
LSRGARCKAAAIRFDSTLKRDVKEGSIPRRFPTPAFFPHHSTPTIMSSSAATYEYDELPEHFFRYLTLHPGVGDDPLTCTLHTSEIDKAEYEAISYVWGSEEQPYDIVANGRLLRITSNLNDALRQLRLVDSPRSLWADSVCINQKDLKEKGHQVAMMGRIYQSAVRVLICLSPAGSEVGPDVRSLLEDVSRMFYEKLYHALCDMRSESDPESSLDLGLQSGLKSSHQFARDHEFSTKNDTGQANGEDNDYRSAVERRLTSPEWDIFPFLERDDPLKCDPRWTYLEVLINQDWFYRGWVVREACLAREALVVWGDSILMWDDLVRTLIWKLRRSYGTITMKHGEGIWAHVNAYEARHQNLISVFYQQSDWAESSLLDYMHYAKVLSLKNPRDRIYAFLDVATGLKDRFDVVPNYTDSPRKVFQDFAASYILSTKDLNIFYYIDHNDTTLEKSALTWVPKWDSGIENLDSYTLPATNQPLRSRTGQVSKPAVLEHDILQVQGIVFDTVRFTSEVSVRDTLTTRSLLGLWLQVRSLIPQNSPYYKLCLEAFFDTLTLGCRYIGDRATSMNERRRTIDLFERLSSQIDDGTVLWDAENLAEFDSSALLAAVAEVMDGNRLIVTQRGYLGSAPRVAQKGDSCAIIFGCFRPCLLREATTKGSDRFVSTSFILGDAVYVIDGESMFLGTFGDETSKTWVNWDIEEQDIHLV